MIDIPDKEIEKIFQYHSILSIKEQLKLFNVIIEKIAIWLDSVHVSVFTLEKNVNNQYNTSETTDYSTQQIEDAMFLMDPIIQLLPELSELMEHKSNNEVQYIKKITKLQSEWSSLQHFLSSVKKLLASQRESKKLLNIIEQLILQIHDISVLIFDFQEKKYHAFALPASVSLSESSSTTDNTTIVSSEDFNKEDLLINEIDHCYEPVLRQMEFLYQKMTTVNEQVILSRFQKLKEKWEILQFERDELKSEQKEDRWLTVFKRVADQVDIMIDGLDRSVVQCYSFVQQIKKQSNSVTTSSLKRPMDKDKFKSVEKSFEAKYKYYTPSIDRMLSMLGDGISARAARDNQTSQRHESMLQRWYHLKQVMDDLRTRDLIDAERILVSASNTSPRFRTPEPSMMSQNKQARFSHTSTSRRNSLNSISDSSSSTIKVVARTPKPSKSIKIDFYEEDEKDFGLDISNLTKTNDRIHKTSRATSSLGHLYNSPSKSLNRRSMTPSLIPRPKTPSRQQQQQQRPKSYQQQRTTSRLGIAPPVPALPKHIQQSYGDSMVYIPDTKDPLDIELSKIINSSPIQIQCQRASSGRYYFGSESSISINGGKKLYACKLMTYSGRKRKGIGQNKVLIRVGGGWQDLEFFLLEHSSFMSSNDPIPTPPKKKFTATNLLNYWKN